MFFVRKTNPNRASPYGKPKNASPAGLRADEKENRKHLTQFTL
jgi:hypothetical protein